MGNKPEKEKTYTLINYGCQMNVRDSETIAGLLEAVGFRPSTDLEETELVVLNTCSVRHSAENKVFGKLGELRKLKRRRPELLVAVGGCMSQLPEARKALKKLGVDIVFGTHNLHELPLLLEQAISDPGIVFRVWEDAGEVIESLPTVRKPGLSAFVNIMFGCDNYCSYCIVPYTRGRERSRKPADILEEIHSLVASGYQEVTLLGQNVNSYGRGLDEAIDFADLLEAANQVQGLTRIRFTTSHPKDMSDKLIDAIARLDKVCEHLHVPLQAGSNKILSAMNRGYTREHYLQLSQRIRQRIPGVAITTDFIVGFPGESEEDFLDTMDMAETVRFDAAFTFRYSQRSGTRAAEMKDQLSLEDKRERLLRLNQAQYRIATEINMALEGTEEEVLVEGPSKTNATKLTGRTRSNRIIIFSGPESLIGQIIHVRITEARTFSLFGELSSTTGGQ
ncbi:MAG TPA: tRNA (N6-isopentenyl adenosine(37)-C2)-methylthiotransferase MiaB [Syntrophomonadaceae bacterium]|nr:tRNA (N6-isopentenyl adenosine(37)-C2)-methylthiotransferase MiaB [Syntrophomonadaceae bacterium]